MVYVSTDILPAPPDSNAQNDRPANPAVWKNPSRAVHPSGGGLRGRRRTGKAASNTTDDMTPRIAAKLKGSAYAMVIFMSGQDRPQMSARRTKAATAYVRARDTGRVPPATGLDVVTPPSVFAPALRM
jgi:hypothetical protein